MATQKDKEKKTILTVFVEGDTEVDFYKKMIASIRQKLGKGKCNVEIKNVKGVGNYQSKVCRIFENSVKKKYPGYNYIVVLCYDTDVFQYSRKPPVDWNAVIKALSDKRADKIEQIRAEKSIEDWFFVGFCWIKTFF